MSDPPRVLVGRYELDSVLGQGGMADVYLATDLLLNRRVAVKILHPQYARDASFVMRFRREAQAAAGLNDPHVVKVYDTGSDDGTYFIVMEYVLGTTLMQVIKEQAPMEPARAATIARDVALAMAAAHAQGIVHRDIKPANIMITPDGEVRVMDFGIARAVRAESVTQTATVLGTATYFSPEQAQGLTVDARSDIYSLGIVLYEMLTRRPPFAGETAVSVAYKHVTEDPAPPTRIEPSIPPALEAVVMKCLAKNADNRYQSADELARDLERFLAGQRVAATPIMPVAATQVVAPMRGGGSSTAVYRPPPVNRRKIRRRRAIAIIVAVLLLGALGIGLGVLANTLLKGNVATKTVPCEPGQPKEQTYTEMSQAGFAHREVPTPSDTIPKDQVVRCSPLGEQEVSTQIDVFVSTGSSIQTGTVPDVFCIPLEGKDGAAQLLHNAGFVIRVGGDDGGSTCTTPGDVASQSPAAFSTQPVGTVVTVHPVPTPPTTTPPPPTTTPPTTPPTSPSPTTPTTPPTTTASFSPTV